MLRGVVCSVGLVLLGGCSWSGLEPASRPQTTVEDAAEALSAVDGLATPIGEVSIHEEALPSRFHAPWPTALHELQRYDLWPRTHAAWALCAGEDRAEAQLLTSITGADIGGERIPAHAAFWGQAAAGCSTRAYCADVLDRIEAAPTADHALVLWMQAAQCGGPLTAEQILRPDAPDQAVLAFARSEGAAVLGYPDPDRVLGALERNAKSLDAAGFTTVATYSLHGGSTDPATLDRLRALAPSWPAGVAPLSDLVAASAAPDPAVRPPAALDDAQRAHLAEIGFTLPAGHPASQHSVRSLLREAGHIVVFDAHTDRWPVLHDEILRQLAATVSPTLDDVVFAEVAEGTAGEGRPHTLHAWTAGKRYSVRAANLDGGFDVPTVLALLAAIVEDGGLDVQIVPIRSEGELSAVLGGPRDAVDAALKQGLVVRE